MAKILLAACNAKYIHSNLAVHYLRAYLETYRPDLAQQVVLREYTINQQKDEILKDIYRISPDVICLSCYIWNATFTRDLLRDLGKILPETELWTGGPEVSYQAEDFLKKNPHVTGVMIGEGEATFLELAEAWQKEFETEDETKTENEIEAEKKAGTEKELCAPEETGHGSEKKSAFRRIPGIAFRAGEEILRILPREPLDLSTVPFPYRDLAPFQNRILYYESSRGCPFSCSYCLSSIERTLRFRSLDLVKKELQFFLDHKVLQVKFVDRTFNCRHSHSLAIWNYILEHDNGITNFHFEIAADLINEEELECMKKMRPGLIQLEIGVQSTNPETITAIRRKTDFQKISSIVSRIQAMGNIHQHLDLIAGLPYETLDIFKKSFADVYALRPEQLQLGFLKVLRGAYMYEAAKEYECIYQSREPYEVLSTRWLPYGDILTLKKVENMVEVYYNSGQFHHTLLYIEEFFEDAFSFYEALGSFYEKKGYDVLSHSRLRRYEILLEFLKEKGGIPLNQVKEKMIYDLYWRENLKNRPAWAYNQKPFEKEIWEYRRLQKIPKTAHIEVQENGTVLLFDYKHRSPLTNNATVTLLDLREPFRTSKPGEKSEKEL